MAKKPPKEPAPKPRAPKGDAGGLTFRQRMFVAAYLTEAKGNATAAARMAGYGGPNVAGHRLLRNANVSAMVAAHNATAGLTLEEVLGRLADIASADLADFVSVPRGTKAPVVDVRKAIKAGKSHLIKELKPTEFGLSIKLHDPLKALELIGKYLRMFDEPPDDGKGLRALLEKAAAYRDPDEAEAKADE